MSNLPVYNGKFGEREAARLLWRAGFGPAPGEARKFAGRFEHVRAAVRSLTRSRRKEALVGPEPRGENNLPLAPNDAYGDDVLWWLDRMVRTTRPFDERMALIWHDWFATGDVNSQYRSLEQANLLRRRGQGSFPDLLLAVTADPAMLLWLSGIENRVRGAERELRPRADGALHPRRLRRFRLSVLRAGRARAGAGADGLDG